MNYYDDFLVTGVNNYFAKVRSSGVKFLWWKRSVQRALSDTNQISMKINPWVLLCVACVCVCVGGDSACSPLQHPDIFIVGSWVSSGRKGNARNAMKRSCDCAAVSTLRCRCVQRGPVLQSISSAGSSPHRPSGTFIADIPTVTQSPVSKQILQHFIISDWGRPALLPRLCRRQHWSFLFLFFLLTQMSFVISFPSQIGTGTPPFMAGDVFPAF